MAKPLTHIEKWLKHVFQNANYANMGDATGLRGSTAAGNFYLSLHLGWGVPGGWDQTSSEASFANYARVAVPRSDTWWSVTLGETTVDVTNLSEISWPAAGAASDQTVYAVGIGTAASGPGQLLYAMQLGIPKRVVDGVIARIEPSGLSISEPAE